MLHLRGGQVTTSVTSGDHDGGDITINDSQFIVLDNSKIVAQADAGNGGNIRIMAEQLIASPNTLISASSNKGISGNVLINSPDNNIAGNLSTLANEFREILTLSDFCNRQLQGGRNHFKIVRHRQRQLVPDDWQVKPSR